MPPYHFGDSSNHEIETCEEELGRVVRRALSFGVMDFSATQGRRTTEEQRRLFRQNKTTIDGVTKKSKHQVDPPGLSRAIDLMPYPRFVNDVDVWQDIPRWCVLAGLMFAAAKIEGVAIRWGGNWDMDQAFLHDQKFDDLPHFELV